MKNTQPFNISIFSSLAGKCPKQSSFAFLVTNCYAWENELE